MNKIVKTTSIFMLIIVILLSVLPLNVYATPNDDLLKAADDGDVEAAQNALKNGTIIIATSTTTAYVSEELLDKKIEDKGMFTAGVVTAKGCCLTDPKERHGHQV